jgi:Fibronectin type III domain/FG-GAP-like repeat
MENILALGGRRTSPPLNDARQPRLVRFDRWTIFLGSIISLLGFLSQARAATSVTLAWDPPSGASGIAGYRLYYGTSSQSFSQNRDLGDTTTTTVSNLVPGQMYYFVITDYDAAGLESLYSNEVSFLATIPIANGSGVAKDFNNDGQPDLVWENTADGEREFWLMNQGVFSSTVNLATVSPGWRIAGVGDFLGNGQSDLVLENASGQLVIWMLEKGVIKYAISPPTLGGGWHVVGAGDFNGSGQADLVLENATTGLRVIWIMNNGTIVSAISLGTVDPSWHVAAVGDFLGNGESDLVWENTANGYRAIWVLKNGAFQSSISLGVVSTQWHIAGASDFNGDGQADLVWENTVTGQRAIWLMKNGAYSSSISLPSFDPHWHIVDH